MYARPEVDGEALTFGVSGMLWREALVMYDRQSRSLWSQRAHRAIAGPRAGDELEVLPAAITDWRSWLESHPETTALVKPGEGILLRLAETFGTAGVWIALALLVVPAILYLSLRKLRLRPWRNGYPRKEAHGTPRSQSTRHRRQRRHW